MGERGGEQEGGKWGKEEIMIKSRYNRLLNVITTVDLHWFEHLRDHENMFEARVVRANEG